MNMQVDEYHPIRQKMVWVGLIQFLASGLVLAGFGAELVEGWAQWLAGGLYLLVLAGVLTAGSTAAEENTTPLTDKGEPLNPEYSRTA